MGNQRPDIAMVTALRRRHHRPVMLTKRQQCFLITQPFQQRQTQGLARPFILPSGIFHTAVDESLRLVVVTRRDERQGIGKALMQQGLADLKANAAQGCALVGDPHYYPQFGFKNSTQLSYTGIPPDYFFILPFTATVPQGIVTFHAGFGATH